MKTIAGWSNLYYVFGISIVALSFITGTAGTKCFKNEEIGDRDGNVYYCDGDKDECCEENGQFTCCESAASQTWRDQAILWGGLAAVLSVIGLVCCFFFKDYFCCKDDTPLAQKCCGCCRKNPDEKDLVPEPETNRPYRPTWARASSSYSPGDDVSRTPPPFTFKSPSYNKY